ncbi:MAG: ribonuclease J [Alphaproteobacteria bacterium]
MTRTFGTPGQDLVFVPLGGAGEIGMNLYLYGHRGRWLMVDLGIGFGDDSMPAIDVVLPDIRFIEERRKELAGLVVTHAHEDHLGAIPYLWSRLRCPIYATPFAAALLETKLKEADPPVRAPITVVPLGGRFDVGPFNVELVSLTHSIPEPNALAIRTGAGLVVHTGDWKFDPHPLVGGDADMAALERLGAEGVEALVGDSTNVFVTGEPGSETGVRESLTHLLGQYGDGAIAVTCFASNVARLESIAHAAAANGRRVALVGRSLWRIVEAARRTGYLGEAGSFHTDDEVMKVPRDRLVYICTGSQGEPRSALARIAGGSHPCVTLGRGDTVLFSSRMIPGNEREIFRMQNQLVRSGVRLVTDREQFIHVSGHPGRDEVERMYRLVRPRAVIPIHGEVRHLTEHARLARGWGVDTALVVEDGTVARLAGGPVEVVGEVPHGKLVVDGSRIMPFESEVLRSRKRMMFNGAVVVTVVVDLGGTLVREPQITAPGIIDPAADEDDHAALAKVVRTAVAGLAPSLKRDDAAVREAVRLAVRRRFKESHGKKPVTDIHLVRI